MSLSIPILLIFPEHLRGMHSSANRVMKPFDVTALCTASQCFVVNPRSRNDWWQARYEASQRIQQTDMWSKELCTTRSPYTSSSLETLTPNWDGSRGGVWDRNIWIWRTDENGNVRFFPPHESSMETICLSRRDNVGGRINQRYDSLQLDHVLTSRRWCALDVIVVAWFRSRSHNRILRAEVRSSHNLKKSISYRARVSRHAIYSENILSGSIFR